MTGHRQALLRAATAAALAGCLAVAVVDALRHPPPAAARTYAPPTMADGTRAPSFTLPRLGGGAAVTLASAAGRPVVLNFFASTCQDCLNELDAFATASHALGSRVAFVAIDSNDPAPATAQRDLRAAGDTYPTGLDAHALVAQQYLVWALPTTFFLDGRGRVVEVVLGSATAAVLEHWAEVAASH